MRFTMNLLLSISWPVVAMQSSESSCADVVVLAMSGACLWGQRYSFRLGMPMIGVVNAIWAVGLMSAWEC